MNVSPINSAYSLCKTPEVPAFKAIVTGNTYCTGSDEQSRSCVDGGGNPISYTNYYETIAHDYYELIDETAESLEKSCKSFPKDYVLEHEDRTQGFEFYKQDFWNKLGVLPIKVAEWAAYTTDKASMALKDVEFIEKVLTRYDLKHLIK